MYISKIRLKNIRRYHDATIEDINKKSILICGNNGSGKSSFLRSIAMAVCDEASAGALLRDLRGDFIRKSSQEKKERDAQIYVELSNATTDKYSIKTELRTKSDAIFETVQTTTHKNEQKIEVDEFPWQNIFVAGYGPGLRTDGTEDYVQYFPADAVYSMFEYSYPLQNPELTWRRFIDVARDSVYETGGEPAAIEAEAEISGLIATELKKILALDGNDDNITLENNGIFAKSDWGKQELSALGDGYRSLITMILDILSWSLLFKNHAVILKGYENNEEQMWEPIKDFKNIEGIVIIDEIEKHLHPRLQHTVISHLIDVFPKVQFIISTHSPLCVSGIADVEEKFLIYCTSNDSNVPGSVILRRMPVPKGLSADDIYRSFFEIGDTRNLDLQGKLARHDELYLKTDKTSAEEIELKEIQAKLSEFYPTSKRIRNIIFDKAIDDKLSAILEELKNKK